jgi:hypothetical protein
MSYQQSGGQPPETPPGYAQPQDPWAGGFEPGQASVPTDPIPQQYDPYTYAQGDPWSQQTVPHGGYAGYPPTAPPRNRALAITLTVVIVLLLGAGAGYGAWYLATGKNGNGGTGSPTTPATKVTTPAQTTPAITTPPAFDAHGVAVGDCLINGGTADDPDMKVVPCTTPKSYKVIKVVQGTAIHENAEGKFDAKTTSVAECKGTGYDSWYAYDDEDDDAKDVFFCMTDNP